MTNFADAVGAFFVSFAEETGNAVFFFMTAIKVCFTTPLKLRQVISQMSFIGVDSWGVVSLTGAAVGGVLAIHSYQGLHRFGADQFIGPIIFISMAREFGPVLSAIMVTGRAGSAIAAELGTMKITEQIDALKTIGINIYQYLIVPRIIASIIMMPFLSTLCTFVGTMIGFLMSTIRLKINSELYIESIRSNVTIGDIKHGLIKSLVFGLLLALIGCYKGINTNGGAKGVGTSTTDAVVSACIAIFIADYLLSTIMK